MSERTEFSSAENDAEQLLASVDTRVLESFGKDAVIYIERGCNEIALLDQLATQRNPFALQPQEADFSFLDPKLLKKIEDRLEEAASFTWSEGRVLTEKEARTSIKLAVGLQILGAKAGNACLKLVKNAEAQLPSHRAGVEDLASEYSKNPDVFDITELQKQMELLTDDVESLPTLATLNAVRGIFENAEDMRSSIESRRRKLLVRFKPGDFAAESTYRRIKQQLQKIDAITASRADAVKKGKSSYASLQDIARREEERKALELLSCLDEASISLFKLAEDSSSPDVLTAERYLISKASAVETYLRGISAPALGRTEIRSLIGRLSTSTLAEAQRSRQTFEEQIKSRDLNTAISEARDILGGGRRLEVKDYERIQQLADNLHKLSRTGGEDLLTTEENGIVVATIAGRFDEFNQTLDRVNSGTDEAVSIVERQRPETIKELRGLNLAAAMDRIRFVLEQDLNDLMQLLSFEDFTRLKHAVEKYYAADNDTVSSEPVHPVRSIEAVLSPKELTNQLDWTVLPKGEEGLEKAAREIVELAQARAARGVHVEIDLERLNILKNVRAAWNEVHKGTGHHFYARGTLKGRGTIAVDGESRPDEYIVLVLQKKDEQGKVVLEHAIAESPITGINALYLLRSDVAPGTWEEIFSLSKKEARELGARDLHHTRGDGRPLVDVLTERVNLLLNCPPEQFFAIRFDGSRIWLRRQLGQVATH